MQKQTKPITHPLAEVFGFPVNNFSAEAKRFRAKRLCPYNNRVPNCTKDKANDPLGTCSIFSDAGISITCPIRFRQNWMIVDAAAGFLFSPNSNWTSLTEVKLKDKHGQSAGNIDVVLVAYDESGCVTDFGALEIQAVYISGNIRNPFNYYINDPENNAQMDWTKQTSYPRPDFLSSSRKRLAPQLIFKGGILKAWKKKLAVAMDFVFFQTLPKLEEIDKENADIAWLIYDIKYNLSNNKYDMELTKIVYTKFEQALDKITKSDAGNIEEFIDILQAKLDERLEHKPDAPLIDHFQTDWMPK
ncbi:MAG: hypothetical protein LBH03_04640 [Holophagales bacterium]|jgi:hypothetical protein|nr:hypothetical protein [Holophagales bacterium]